MGKIYKYHRYNLLLICALILVPLNFIEKHGEIGKAMNDHLGIESFIPLLFKIFLWPSILYMVAMYYKKIFYISTDTSGIKFYNHLKQIYMPWNEIKKVKRIGYRRIKVFTDSERYSFSADIALTKTDKINLKDNVFKQCALLEEIYINSRNAEFKGFPEGTFNS